MSAVDTWNGGLISDGKRIRITIDEQAYDLAVGDDRCYRPGESRTGPNDAYTHVTSADGCDLYFTSKVDNPNTDDSKVIVKILEWPSRQSRPLNGTRLKIISIAGREVECQEIRKGHGALNF